MAPNDDHGKWPQRPGSHIANPTGLMELPVELRTEIYSYLLPFVKRNWSLGVPLKEPDIDNTNDDWYLRDTDWGLDHPDPDLPAYCPEIDENMRPMRLMGLKAIKRMTAMTSLILKRMRVTRATKETTATSSLIPTRLLAWMSPNRA